MNNWCRRRHPKLYITFGPLTLIRYGSSRWVILSPKYAFKFPALWSYKSFIRGLLHNINEKDTWDALQFSKNVVLVVPTLYSSRLGLLNIMPRCGTAILTENTKQEMARAGFRDLHNDNVGLYNKTTRLIDYG